MPTTIVAVTVEFYGIPRLRAGRAMLAVEASTLADALGAIERACPQLTGLRQADGGLAPQYLLAIDGQGFVRELEHPLHPGDRLLLLSADVGG